MMIGGIIIMFENSLIFGKNIQNNIVGIEVKDATAELFIEKDGVVSSQYVPHKYWLLSAQPYNGGWTRLKGDLHFKYGKQWDNFEDYNEQRKKLYGKDTYCVWDAKEAFLINKGYTYYKGMNPKDVSILSFDIETDGLVHHDGSRVFLISNTYRNKHGIQKKLFCFWDYENDGEMLEDWCNWVLKVNPSILTGHNINGYDFPYIAHVASLYGVSITIGRDSSPITIAKKESNFRIDGSRDLHYKKVKCYGREIIDTMFLAYKYDTVEKKYDSYGLKPIIKKENLEAPGRTFYDASTIKKNIFIPEEREKIVAYARDDADDALKLFDLMAAPFFYMANSIPKPFQTITESATGSQINALLVRSYLQQGHSIPKASEVHPFEGAISDGYAGVYKNCLKWDVASLYPSVMIEYKVNLGDKDPNNHFGILVDYYTSERLKNKKLAKTTGEKYYDDVQGAQKILINSFYGFLSTNGLQFNSPAGAAFVTEKGREILKKAIMWACSKEYSPSEQT